MVPIPVQPPLLAEPVPDNPTAESTAEPANNAFGVPSSSGKTAENARKHGEKHEFGVTRLKNEDPRLLVGGPDGRFILLRANQNLTRLLSER